MTHRVSTGLAARLASSALPLVLGAALVSGPSAHADDVTARAAADAVWRPLAEQYARPAPPSAPTAATEGWRKTLDAASRTWVRRIPASQSMLSLQGERAVRKVPMYFSAADAGRATEFRVGALTAVAALAEASSLDVYLNGSLLGTVEPRYDAPSTATFPLQPGYLVEGFNEVMFVARHQHRVDCSIAGTYELWTQVLPELTGIAGNGLVDKEPTIADLPTLIGQNLDPTRLSVRLPAGIDDNSASRITRLVNALVLNGWIVNPRVVVEDRPSEETAGIALSLASATPATTRGQILAFVDAPSLFLETDVSGGTTGLVLAGSNADIDRDLARLEERARLRAPTGSARGVQSLVAAFGYQRDDASSMTLRSLGIETVSFEGRRFRLDIPTLLPGDFYQSDYGNMLLYLDGAYSGGLLPNSTLKIKVNDVETVTLPLNDRRPTAFKSKEIRIPLGMFHAGMNTLTIEAELINLNDLVCAPENVPVVTPRLELSDSSRIVVPKMARVGVAPNLSATFSHGYPYTLDAAPTTVFVAGDRTKAFATTLSLLAAITANAQRTDLYDFAFRVPSEDETGILVGAPDALPNWANVMIGKMTETGDEPGPRTVPDGTDEDGADRDEPALLSRLAPDAGPVQVAAATTGLNDSIDDPLVRQRFGIVDDKAAEAGFLVTVGDTIAAVREGLSDRSTIELGAVGEQLSFLGDFMFNGFDRPDTRRIYKPGDVVFAQRAVAEPTGWQSFVSAVVPHAPPRTWTVVAASDPTVLSDALDGISAEGVAFNPNGQHYVYGPDRDRMIEAGEEGQLYATQTPGPINLRLVSAGWLSKNVRVYVALVIPITLLLGLATFMATRRGRRRRAS